MQDCIQLITYYFLLNDLIGMLYREQDLEAVTKNYYMYISYCFVFQPKQTNHHEHVLEILHVIHLLKRRFGLYVKSLEISRNVPLHQLQTFSLRLLFLKIGLPFVLD